MRAVLVVEIVEVRYPSKVGVIHPGGGLRHEQVLRNFADAVRDG